MSKPLNVGLVGTGGMDIGAKYGGGSGDPHAAPRRRDTTASGETNRWVVFLPDRLVSRDTAKIASPPSNVARTAAASSSSTTGAEAAKERRGLMTDYPREGAVIQAYYEERRNWGRWGDDDEVGALNLITDEKRLEAVALVAQGRTVSMNRPYPKHPGPRNPSPAQHFMRASIDGQAGGVVDYYGFIYHGQQMTHLDALCHVWEGGKLWNGRDPQETLQADGARFGDVTAWRQGIVTRGVFLDVVRHRGEPYVAPDRPVHGEELEAIAAAQGVEVRPGDALIVHSGYGAYVTEHPEPEGSDSPGLHASCAPFVREHDVSILGWDLMDARPNAEGLRWPMHGVLFNFGVALLDNALLEPLAEACAEEGRYEFMFMAHPLRVEGGTGSPVNPIAMF